MMSLLREGARKVERGDRGKERKRERERGRKRGR